MWSIFYLEIFHFVLNIFAGLTFFLIFYLYFDAWLIKKEKGGILKLLGYLFLSISFLIHSLYLEVDLINSSLVFDYLNKNFYSFFRVFGYIFLLVGLYFEPLPRIPFEKMTGMVLFLGFPWQFLNPFLSSIIALLYWRRMSLGLERHLKRVSIGFYLLSLSELFSLAEIFEATQNPYLFSLVSPFKPLWFTSHLFLLASVLILFFWVWYYLFKRISTQLFIVFQTISVIIFLLTTVLLTSILIKNIEADKKAQLLTDIKILNFVIDTKKQALLSQTVSLSREEDLIEACFKTDKKFLYQISLKYLLDHQKTSVLILSKDGQVLARGENKEQIGESLSDNFLVKRAKKGEKAATLTARQEVLAPVILFQAIAPIFKNEEIIGFLIMEEKLDNSFIDGLKKSTGLEVSIYGNNKLSATTIDLYGKNISYIGIEENNQKLLKKIFDDKEIISLSTSILNIPYLSVFSPILDINHRVIGMFFIGYPEIKVLQSVIDALRYTFLMTIFLIIFSILPIYYLSEHVKEQLR